MYQEVFNTLRCPYHIALARFITRRCLSYFDNLGDRINVSVYNSSQCWVVNKEGHLEIDKDSLGHFYLELKDDDDSVVYGVLLGVDLDLNDLKKLIYYTAKKGLSLQENLSIKITIIKYYTLNL